MQLLARINIKYSNVTQGMFHQFGKSFVQLEIQYE